MVTSEDLKEFGKVEKCEETNESFHVLITNDFENKVDIALDLFNKINESIVGKYPNVKKLVIDKNNFEYIAKK